MASMREIDLSKFITNYDFKSPDWTVKNIKESLQGLLGELPAIEIVYEKDAFLNEVTGRAQEVKKIKSVKVTFTDLDEKIRTVEYLVEV